MDDRNSVASLSRVSAVLAIICSYLHYSASAGIVLNLVSPSSPLVEEFPYDDDMFLTTVLHRISI